MVCDWDDLIPDPLQQEWQRFREKISQIEHLIVPIWIGAAPNNRSYQLHVFSHVSTIPYAGVVYLCVKTSGNDIKISILSANTRLNHSVHKCISKRVSQNQELTQVDTWKYALTQPIQLTLSPGEISHLSSQIYRSGGTDLVICFT